MAKITKREIREGLEQIPIEQILLGSIGDKQLTHKQKTFAKQVALGKPKAQAYKIAYDSNGNPITASANAQKLMGDTRIKLLVEAYSRAFEAREYQKPERLRELVIHQLTELALNPEVKDAQRIRSLELLGKVSEVGAFTERKETKVIHESSKIKEKLLEQLKTIINVDAKELDDGESLLAELSGKSAESENPTTTRPPQIDHAEGGTVIHSIPLTQSADPNDGELTQSATSESTDSKKEPQQATDSEEEKSKVETFPPLSDEKKDEKEGVGVVNSGEEKKSENIETPPHANWKEKG